MQSKHGLKCDIFVVTEYGGNYGICIYGVYGASNL